MVITGHVSAALPVGEYAQHGVPSPAGTSPYEEHAPIRIEEDPSPSLLPPDLLPSNAPSNGIRSGTGTAEDPYVIERWSIHLKDALMAAVTLRNLEAYYLVRDLQIHGMINEKGQEASNGFLIADSKNVEVSNIDFQHLQKGVVAEDVEKILVHNVSLSDNSMLEFVGCDEVIIRDVRAEGPGAHVFAWDSNVDARRLYLRQNTTSGIGQGWLTGGVVSAFTAGGDGSIHLEDLDISGYQRPGGSQSWSDASIKLQGVEATIDRVFVRDADVGLGTLNASVEIKRAALYGAPIGWVIEGSCQGCLVAGTDFHPSVKRPLVNRGTDVVSSIDNWFGAGRSPEEALSGPHDDSAPRAMAWSPVEADDKKNVPGLSVGVILALLVLLGRERSSGRRRFQ